VLPRRNRIVEPADFRSVVRRGEKYITEHLIGYRVPAGEARVGIVVTVKAGNAIARNTARRRIRAIARKLIDEGQLDGDIIFRFRGDAGATGFVELESELNECATKWAS
jgi:ribonuclease P protein component